MRLKSLFFPIMMVLSLAIFIGYVWPQIDVVRKINEEILTKRAEMQAVNDKKLAIESVGKKISDNAAGENVVLSYLPQNKTEEQIIGGVNYLAGDANVSLVDITLNSVDSSSKNNNTITTSLLTGLDSVKAQTNSSTPNDGLMQSTSVKIALFGDYAKIRIFLDSLQRMPVFNTIKSINIEKQVAKEKITETGEVVAATESTNAGLLVNIDVDFGYLNTAKADNKQVELFKNGIDNEVVSVLQSYISQKSQLVDDSANVDGGSSSSKGKKNPFLTN